MINEQSFYDIVDIKEEEKESSKVFLENRGVTEHIRMAEYLSAFINRKPTYAEVATAFRYDKRIRRIIYKYLGLLEERIRAYLADRYETIGDIPRYKANLIKNQKHLKDRPLSTNTYDFVNELLFSNLINIIINLDGNGQEAIFGTKVMKKNLLAASELRNAISHNRTLLNYRRYKEVSLVDGNVSSSLSANVKNLYLLLPVDIRDCFKDEVNDATNFSFNSLPTQVGWNILEIYIVKL